MLQACFACDLSRVCFVHDYIHTERVECGTVFKGIERR